MAYRHFYRTVPVDVSETDISDEGQGVKRLLDYLDILYTERQQRERIAECRAMLPNRLHKRVYDAVLKGLTFEKIERLVKRGERQITRIFTAIITIIEKSTMSTPPPFTAI